MVSESILQMSALYAEEEWFLPDADAFDLRGLEGSFRYCSAESESTVRALLGSARFADIAWIDTGDFHYLSKLRMELIREPFALALYDNHPDDQEGAFDSDILSCGNWVLAARRSNPFLKEDFRNPEPSGGRFPWGGSPKRSSLEGSSAEGLPLFISIDIDLLSEEYARTGWSQGSWSLDRLLRSLDALCKGRVIAGVDICGGITAAQGGRDCDRRVNLATRRALRDYFCSQPIVWRYSQP